MQTTSDLIVTWYEDRKPSFENYPFSNTNLHIITEDINSNEFIRFESESNNFIEDDMIDHDLRYFDFLNDKNKFNIEKKIKNINTTDNRLFEDCNICYENVDKKNMITLNCNHEFCNKCINNIFKNSKRKQPCCSFCREKISILEFNNQEIYNELDEYILL